MKYFFLIISTLIFGCNNSKKIIENNQYGEFVYHSGNFSGIDYIMISKKEELKKKYELTIDCNHYIKDIGKTIFLKKTLFLDPGENYTTFHFIRDSLMLSKMNYGFINQGSNSSFVKLSNEEYEGIKTSFVKYPFLATKYALNADSLKNYLGWLEIKK